MSCNPHWPHSQEKLREYFGQFGSVTDVLVMKDPITQVILVPDSHLSALSLPLDPDPQRFGFPKK